MVQKIYGQVLLEWCHETRSVTLEYSIASAFIQRLMRLLPNLRALELKLTWAEEYSYSAYITYVDYADGLLHPLTIEPKAAMQLALQDGKDPDGKPLASYH